MVEERIVGRRWHVGKRLAAGLAVVLASLTVTAAVPDEVSAAPATCQWLTRYWAVNVRTGPGTSYAVKGQMNTASAGNSGWGPCIPYRTVDGTTGCRSGRWAKIRWYGVGYVCTTYVTSYG